jgi:hypothetical protein
MEISPGLLGPSGQVSTVGDPAANLTPAQVPDPFGAYCTLVPGQVDNSASCTDAVLTDINYAHSLEGVGPITLPTDWASLTTAQQLVVLFNLERRSFGLPPLAGVTGSLDAAALNGAEAISDPDMPPTSGLVNGGAVWAGGYPNVLGADFGWMYDDGWGGFGNTDNSACTSAGAAGCWGHREVVLTDCRAAGVLSCNYVAGAAEVAAPVAHSTISSYTAIVASVGGPVPPLAWSPFPLAPHGYWLVAADGGIFSFGSAPFFGSTGNLHLQRPVVGISPTSDRRGYLMVASDGGMFAFGAARFEGSLPALGIRPVGSGGAHALDAPVDAMVPSPDGRGYLLVAADGGVFAFGDASFHGSCPQIGGCSGRVVAVVPDAGERGYWIVTSTGSVYRFGNAPAFGGPGRTPTPVTGAAASPSGNGYYVVDAGGNVYAYGDASWQGGSQPSGAPVVGIIPTADSQGYWIVGADGAVEGYGDAFNLGSMAGRPLNAAVVTASGY